MIRYLLVVTILLFSSLAQAEYDKSDKVEHGFYEAADEYKALAKKYKKKGMHSIAADYDRMSEIKTNAGKLADKGRWDDISWDEYKSLEESVSAKLK